MNALAIARRGDPENIAQRLRDTTAPADNLPGVALVHGKLKGDGILSGPFANANRVRPIYQLFDDILEQLFHSQALVAPGPAAGCSPAALSPPSITPAFLKRYVTVSDGCAPTLSQ